MKPQYFLVGLATLLHSSLADPKPDFATACYGEVLPNLPAPPENRTIPWGSPSIVNGSTTCCSSLDEVRAGIDAVDAQLLSLLAQRCVFTHSLSLRVLLTAWNQLEPLLYAKLRVLRVHMTRWMCHRGISRLSTMLWPMLQPFICLRRSRRRFLLPLSTPACRLSFVW